VSTHKDLPPGSQQWARELDDAMKEIKRLQGVVSRLAENAGIDQSNPRRGLNAGAAPSVKNPVGQKLSSLADVDTYNVADGQGLSWSQQGQKWLPATPVVAGAAIPIPMAYYGGDVVGYGQIDGPNFLDWAYTGTRVDGPPYYAYGFAETWGGTSSILGAGDPQSSYALVQPDYNGGDPTISLYVYNESAGEQCQLFVQSNSMRVDYGVFRFALVNSFTPRPVQTSFNPGGAVYDDNLKIPIWWNGTTWTDALGTAV